MVSEIISIKQELKRELDKLKVHKDGKRESYGSVIERLIKFFKKETGRVINFKNGNKIISKPAEEPVVGMSPPPGYEEIKSVVDATTDELQPSTSEDREAINSLNEATPEEPTETPFAEEPPTGTVSPNAKPIPEPTLNEDVAVDETPDIIQEQESTQENTTDEKKENVS